MIWVQDLQMLWQLEVHAFRHRRHQQIHGEEQQQSRHEIVRARNRRPHNVPKPERRHVPSQSVQRLVDAPSDGSFPNQEERDETQGQEAANLQLRDGLYQLGDVCDGLEEEPVH
eukprot:CAMPEP_0181525218 /NCGR_PEP_ID=MMETSP1110-20121109/68853_1 /TAXON_ID=174948 /ORGANISM="Symbiodinium sp., Strain CCMP421" /LENGTH=113 /DNA_ID=CAMNT_0023656013 /DNA_START=505 /DNA_END=846 /DNA_ORIENTATION=-